MGNDNSTGTKIQVNVAVSYILLILEFSSWNDRYHLCLLNKATRAISVDDSFYRWLCSRLVFEHQLYIPLTGINNWKSVFYELYKKRDMWMDSSAETSIDVKSDANAVSNAQMLASTQSRFKINVFAKFRPVSMDELLDSCAEANENEDVQVTLPLHQRLAMIKLSHRTKSNRKALQVLTNEGGWFKSKWNNVISSQQNILNNSNVASDQSNLDIENCRETDSVNKLNIANQKSETLAAKVQTIDPGSGRVVLVAPDVGLREFEFDGVFSSSTSQKVTYDTTTRGLVRDLFNGYNATALVYGMTSSGKTFTMFGREEDLLQSSVNLKPDAGIVPRACNEIFTAMKQRYDQHGIVSEVAISYVEIFGDQITDLLKNGSRCGHSKAASQQFVLQGAAEVTVSSVDDIRKALVIGEAQKRRAATAMNARSTRAHAIFILSLKQTSSHNITHTSKLFLADLGGSEKVKKSQVDAGGRRDQGEYSVGFELGRHMREAVYINLGLLALKKCIEALNVKASYVPYQDSKLTMLLSAGIGGNSKCSVIVCSRMESSHINETVSTLKFGEACSLIQNSLSNKSTMLIRVLENLDKEIKDLEDVIRSKERWIDVIETRQDVNAEEGTLEKAVGGREVKKVSKLVGAEQERRELDILLSKRHMFIGVDSIDDLGSFNSIDSSELASINTSNNLKSFKKTAVLGFGKELAEVYGLGSKYDESIESVSENTRFSNRVEQSSLPLRVRGREWKFGDALAQSNLKLDEKALKMKRNKLSYAGLSS